MVLFLVVGLIAAFLTVICWFLWLAGRSCALMLFAQRIAVGLQHWLCWWSGRYGVALALLLSLLLALLLLHMLMRDDVC